MVDVVVVVIIWQAERKTNQSVVADGGKFVLLLNSGSLTLT